MPNVSNLVVIFDADTGKFEQGTARVNQGLKGVEHSAGGAFDVLKGFLGGQLVLGGIGALVGGVRSAVDTFSSFEAKMSEVKAVSGASAETFDAMRQKALDLGRDTSFSATQAAAGLAELVKGGLSGEDAMAAIGATLNLAAAGGTSLAEASEIAANSLNTFSLNGEHMAEVSDLIAGVANASSASVRDFGYSLAAGGAVAKAVGFDIQNFSYVIAAMGQQGIKGQDAGTSLKSMFLALANPTAKATELMHHFGIEMFDSSGKIKDASAMAGNLQSSLGNLNRQQQVEILSKIFGSDGVRAALILMDQGREGIDKIKTSMADVTAEKVAAVMMDNLKGRIEAMGGSAETLAIKLGSKLEPALSKGVKAATDFLNAVGNDQTVMDFIGTVGDGLASAAQIGADAIGNIIGMVTNLEGVFSSTGGDRAGFIEMLGFSQEDANKIGAILDTIQGKVGALMGIFSSTGGERAGFFEQLGLNTEGANAAGALLDGLQKNFTDMVTGLSGAAATATPIIDGFASTMANIGGAAVQAVPGILQAVASAADGIKSGLEGANQAVADLQAKWDGLGPGMQAFILAAGGTAVAIAAIAAAWLVLAPVIAAAPAVLGLVALGFMGVAAGIGTAVVAAAPFLLIAAAIAVAVGLLAAAWVTNFGDIQGKTQAAVEAVQTFGAAIMNQDWATAFSGLGTAAAMAGELLASTFQQASETMAGVFNGIGNAAGEALGGIGSAITEAAAPFAPFGEAVSKALGDAKQYAEEFGLGLQVLAGLVLSALAPAGEGASQFGSMVSAGMGIAGEALSALGDLAGTALGAVGTWLQTPLPFMDTLQSAIASGTAAAGSALSSFGETAGSAMSGAGLAISTFSSGAGEAWASVVSKAGEMAAGVIAKGKEIIAAAGGWEAILRTAALAAGAALIDGLTGGIGSKIGGLISYIHSVGEKAAQAMRDSVGVKSPSTVFAAIGDQMMAGLTDGIEGASGTALAAVEQLGADMVDAADTAVGGRPSRRLRETAEGMVYGLSAGIYAAGPTAVRDVEAWINDITMAATEAIGGAPSMVFQKLGEGAAKGFTLGLLGQMQTSITSSVAGLHATVDQLIGPITTQLGDMSVDQARKVRDAVATAATAQQKAIDAQAQAQAKYDEATKLAGKKGHDAAVAAAQDAAIAADKAIQAAALAAQKVVEVTADVTADNAAAATKAAQKAADDAERLQKKMTADALREEKQRVADAKKAWEDWVKLGAEQSRYRTADHGAFMPGDPYRGRVAAANNEFFASQAATDTAFDTSPAAMASAATRAAAAYADAATEAINGPVKRRVGGVMVDLGESSAAEFGKGFGHGIATGLQIEEALKKATAAAAHAAAIHFAQVWSDTPTLLTQNGLLSAKALAATRKSAFDLVTGMAQEVAKPARNLEEQLSRAFTGMLSGKNADKLAQAVHKMTDGLVSQFDEAGKKAGDALASNVVRTIAELNKLPPIDLDNLLPGHGASAPKGIDPKSFDPLKSSNNLEAIYSALPDEQLYELGASLGVQFLVTSYHEKMTADLKKRIIQRLLGYAATGFRHDLGDDNPLRPEPVFAQRMATGWVGNSPTLAIVGDTRKGDPEHVHPESRLRRVVREEMGDTYVILDGEVVAAAVQKRQNRRMARVV